MSYTLKQAARDTAPMAPERPSIEQIRAVLIRVLGRQAIRSMMPPSSWAPSVTEEVIAELREGDMVPDADLFEAKQQRDEAREQRNRAQRQVADLRDELAGQRAVAQSAAHDLAQLEDQLKAADEDRDRLRRRLSDETGTPQSEPGERDEAQAELGKLRILVRGVCQTLKPMRDGWLTDQAVEALPRIAKQAVEHGYWTEEPAEGEERTSPHFDSGGRVSWGDDEGDDLRIDGHGVDDESYVLKQPDDSVDFTQRITIHPDGTVEIQA